MLAGELCGAELKRAFTWNDVARIHRVFVLDEAEAIHEFDFDNLAGTMGREVCLDVTLSSCRRRVSRHSRIRLMTPCAGAQAI